MNQGFGVLIDWNMQTFRASDGGEADLAVDTWSPTGLDIDNWLDAAVSAGATYAVLTVKAGAGFCLWPTAYHVDGYDPYSIAQTAWYAANGNPDIAALFVAKCRTRNLNPCFYFAMDDMTYLSRSGVTKTTFDDADYAAMVTTQLTELLTNYGDITAIWCDGWYYQVGYQKAPFSTFGDVVHSLQPNCLLIDNPHQHPPSYSHIEVYETAVDGSIPSGNTRLCEEVKSIRADGRWYWHSGDGQTGVAFTSAANIQAAIAQANNNSATYLLAITPATNGALPVAQVTRLTELGA